MCVQFSDRKRTKTEVWKYGCILYRLQQIDLSKGIIVQLKIFLMVLMPLLLIMNKEKAKIFGHQMVQATK